MTTRLFALPAVFALLCFSGCADAVDPPPAEEKPKAEPLKPKVTAELLVGNWEWVKTDDNPISGIVKETVTFSADGKFYFRYSAPEMAPQVIAGDYRLEGRSIIFMNTPKDGNPGKIWGRSIEAISDTELIMLWRPEENGQQFRSKYKRIEQ